MPRSILPAAPIFLISTFTLAQPLPTDPKLVTGTLDNGLSYIIRKHDNPPGRAALYLHVASGSLNETDKQRGLAHYLEHLAFNGSENFPPGSVVPLFESMGLTFGQHQNAFTSFDQTTYTLEMPDNKSETLDKALSFFSDVAFHLLLLPAEIDSERQVIMEEKRTRLGAQQRVQEYIFERLAPGSIFGQRLPIGTEETLMAAQQADFKDYYSRWYVPSNMTAIVVADMDPMVVAEKIKSAFGKGEKKPKPAPQDIGLKPASETRAIVASDPELRDAQVAIGWLTTPKSPVTTVERFREDLVAQLATRMVSRRMEARVNAGNADYLGAVVFEADLFQAIHIAQVGSQGDPAKWRDMLKDVAEDLQGARLNGFNTAELDDVRRELLAGAERAVETEPTRAARAILGMINASVAAQEPVMSAQQRLDVIKAVLPTITPDEVSKRFAADYDPSIVTFLVQVPTSVPGGVPTEADVIALGRQALDVKPKALDQSDRPTELLSAKPRPGSVVETTTHEPSKVQSAWLSDGVRVHYRFMDYKKDEVTVSISLAGGEIEETPENHGVSTVAALAWDRAATSRLTSTNIRDLMTGKKVRVGGGPGGDSMWLSISGSPVDIETGFQLAHLLLTDPRIEQSAFDTWKTETLQEIEARKVQPQGAIGDLFASLLPPGEVRTLPLEKHEVEKLSVQQGQAWLNRIIKSAPIEVAIVGDIPAERAMELAALYLGSLPPRDRISDKTLDNLRNIPRPGREIVKSLDLKTMTPVAIVIGGFFGADAADMANGRPLRIAAQILSTRMNKKIREEEQLVYGIGAQHSPGSAYPGWGRFISGAPTEPAKAEKLSARIREMFFEFAAGGPTEDEMVVARKQIANELDESMKEPSWWLAFLGDLTCGGLNLDEMISGPAVYPTITAERVKEVFASHCKPESTFFLTVKPAPSEAPAPAAPTTPEKK
ncbi:MAG: insulinase family protein [Phycisphaerales bacterium]|nr:insulinase family protein [Phycisphaerales bacterium]